MTPPCPAPDDSNAEIAADPLVLLDARFHFAFVNDRAASVLDAEAGALLGLPASQKLPRPLFQEIAEACRRASADGRAVQLRFPLQRPDQWWTFRVHPRELGWSVRFWADGDPETASGSGGGTTGLEQQHGLQNARAEGDARLRELMDDLEIGVHIVRDHRVIYANPHFRRIFGYAGDEPLIGRRITDLIVEADRPVILDLIRVSLANGGSTARRRVLRGERADRSLVELEVHGNRGDMDGLPAFIGFVMDVTERERAAAALREREEQLRHAQKLEAVGRLAGGIAHDFNNLLMVIQGSVSLILMDTDSVNPHRVDLEEIGRATERAAELTRQLLAFGRKQVLRPKVINLNSSVEDLNKMIARVIGADIELRTELAPDLENVRVDPGQLEQVILNLIVNARDAMPGGGVLTLRTEHWNLTEEDAARAPYRVVPGPYVRLTVSDTGFGMPESVVSQVFEPFFTTKPRGKGTGLGLSTAYGIVKQSAGYIWITSQAGRGTSIEIYLPRVQEPAETASSTEIRALPRGSGRVLLVEDEEPVRVVTRRLLEQGGYTVIEASGGREAVELYDACGGNIDLVLTDVVMPQMGGREMATHLRARDPSLRLLYMSGYADNRSVRRGSAGADDDFIQKPFTPEGLLARIGALLSDQ